MKAPSEWKRYLSVGIMLLATAAIGATSAGFLPFTGLPGFTYVATGGVAALFWWSAYRLASDSAMTRAWTEENDRLSRLRQALTRKDAEIDELRAIVSKSALDNDTEKKIAELEDTKLAVLNLLEDIDSERAVASDARARLEAVISSIADGVCVVNRDLQVVMCNPAATRMFELKGQYVGQDWRKVGRELQIDDKPLADEERPLVRSINEKRPVTQTVFVVRSDGRLPVSINSSPVISQGKVAGAVAVFRDITVEYQLDRAKSEFVSVASHQLRTPLTAISWYSESIMDGDYGEVSPELSEPLHAIHTSSQRMSKLINALLNASRIETGSLRIAPTPIDFKELAVEVLGETIVHWKEKKLLMDVQCAPDLPKINADRSLMKIVIQNLLTNAIKYSPNAGKVMVRMEAKDKSLVTAVTDSGIGIPQAAQGRIFEKLFRAENAAKSSIDGTGLGLYIAKAIVEQSGGSLSFTSEENKGTTFLFTIPLAGVTAKEGTRTLIADF